MGYNNVRCEQRKKEEQEKREVESEGWQDWLRPVSRAGIVNFIQKKLSTNKSYKIFYPTVLSKNVLSEMLKDNFR